jgi:putative flippase GtrA
MLAGFIIKVLDWIYPLFRRFMPRQTFYYAACGGGNTLLGIALFFLSFHFVVKKQIVHLPFIAISPHIAAMFISYLITFVIGFFLARTVVFSDSSLRGRQQLFRYFATSQLALLLNYINLKILVDTFNVYPTVAQIINTVIVVSFSYLAQRHFAFRAKKVNA